MKIFVFGSSITSCYWNGAATYYRGIYRNLAALGHDIIFAEPDIYGRQQNRDRHDVNYADVIVYRTPVILMRCSHKPPAPPWSSNTAAWEPTTNCWRRGCSSAARRSTQVAFWDVDAPATLARVEADPDDPFRRLIPQYDFIFTYGGGAPVVRHYLPWERATAIRFTTLWIPTTHHPVAADPALACDLLFVGNRLPDREQRVEEFFLRAAELAPEMSFILGGEGWSSNLCRRTCATSATSLPIGTTRLNCSARMVLNVNRESMAKSGLLAAHACLRGGRRRGLFDYRPLGGNRDLFCSRQGTAGGGPSARTWWSICAASARARRARLATRCASALSGSIRMLSRAAQAQAILQASSGAHAGAIAFPRPPRRMPETPAKIG